MMKKICSWFKQYFSWPRIEALVVVETESQFSSVIYEDDWSVIGANAILIAVYGLLCWYFLHIRLNLAKWVAVVYWLLIGFMTFRLIEYVFAKGDTSHLITNDMAVVGWISYCLIIVLILVSSDGADRRRTYADRVFSKLFRSFP